MYVSSVVAFAMHLPARALFLLAHPDDELYVCALMQRLLRAGRDLAVVYATTGDAKGLGDLRRAELRTAMRTIGVPAEALHLLEIPEREVLARLPAIVTETLAVGAALQPGVIISHDYEGGHEAHDGVSFAAAEVARRLPVARHVVFPLYHGKPTERRGARFKPGRQGYTQLRLRPEEAALKEQVRLAHASQAGHFRGLQQAASDYRQLLHARELYLELPVPEDYRQPPMLEVGYEFHRNGFTFADFRAALAHYEASLPPQG